MEFVSNDRKYNVQALGTEILMRIEIVSEEGYWHLLYILRSTSTRQISLST